MSMGSTISEKELSKAVKTAAISLSQSGMKSFDIAKVLKVPVPVLMKWLKTSDGQDPNKSRKSGCEQPQPKGAAKAKRQYSRKPKQVAAEGVSDSLDPTSEAGKPKRVYSRKPKPTVPDLPSVATEGYSASMDTVPEKSKPKRAYVRKPTPKVTDADQTNQDEKVSLQNVDDIPQIAIPSSYRTMPVISEAAACGVPGVCEGPPIIIPSDVEGYSCPPEAAPVKPKSKKTYSRKPKETREDTSNIPEIGVPPECLSCGLEPAPEMPKVKRPYSRKPKPASVAAGECDLPEISNLPEGVDCYSCSKDPTVEKTKTKRTYTRKEKPSSVGVPSTVTSLLEPESNIPEVPIKPKRAYSRKPKTGTEPDMTGSETLQSLPSMSVEPGQDLEPQKQKRSYKRKVTPSSGTSDQPEAAEGSKPKRQYKRKGKMEVVKDMEDTSERTPKLSMISEAQLPWSLQESDTRETQETMTCPSGSQQDDGLYTRLPEEESRDARAVNLSDDSVDADASQVDSTTMCESDKHIFKEDDIQKALDDLRMSDDSDDEEQTEIGEQCPIFVPETNKELVQKRVPEYDAELDPRAVKRAKSQVSPESHPSHQETDTYKPHREKDAKARHKSRARSKFRKWREPGIVAGSIMPSSYVIYDHKDLAKWKTPKISPRDEMEVSPKRPTRDERKASPKKAARDETKVIPKKPIREERERTPTKPIKSPRKSPEEPREMEVIKVSVSVERLRKRKMYEYILEELAKLDEKTDRTPENVPVTPVSKTSTFIPKVNDTQLVKEINRRDYCESVQKIKADEEDDRSWIPVSPGLSISSSSSGTKESNIPEQLVQDTDRQDSCEPIQKTQAVEEDDRSWIPTSPGLSTSSSSSKESLLKEGQDIGEPMEEERFDGIFDHLTHSSGTEEPNIDPGAAEITDVEDVFDDTATCPVPMIQMQSPERREPICEVESKESTLEDPPQCQMAQEPSEQDVEIILLDDLMQLSGANKAASSRASSDTISSTDSIFNEDVYDRIMEGSISSRVVDVVPSETSSLERVISQLLGSDSPYDVVQKQPYNLVPNRQPDACPTSDHSYIGKVSEELNTTKDVDREAADNPYIDLNLLAEDLQLTETESESSTSSEDSQSSESVCEKGADDPNKAKSRVDKDIDLSLLSDDLRLTETESETTTSSEDSQASKNVGQQAVEVPKDDRTRQEQSFDENW